MDLFQSMRAFVAVTEAGSFVRAADQLAMSKSAVTAHLAELERRLAVRLLNRTTRRLSLTDDGRAYLEHCRRVLSDVDETIGLLSQGRGTPRGRLRIDTASSIGIHFLMPALPRFTEQFPELEVVLTLNDQVVDIVAEGVDVAIRAGELPSSSYVARRVFNDPYVICAAPSYLERFGMPSSPDELDAHNCLLIYLQTAGHVLPWEFEHNGVRTVRTPRARLSVSSTEALIAAAIRGAGIVYLTRSVLGRGLAAGQLTPILNDWVRKDPLPISVVYPHNRQLSAKTRAFVDFVAGLFPRTARKKGDEPQPVPSNF